MTDGMVLRATTQISSAELAAAHLLSVAVSEEIVASTQNVFSTCAARDLDRLSTF
jgi:hypothetical protein